MVDTLSTLIAWLDACDKSLLLKLNGPGSAIADAFWWGISDKWIWIPVGVSVVWSLLDTGRGWRHTLWMLCLLAVVIALSDTVSASMIKPLFARLRPSHDGAVCELLHYVHGYRGGMYGFVSSHAANAFGAAVFLALIFRNQWMTLALLGWAVAIGYSRIYLGVHYPGDVLGGALLGSVLAWGGYRVYTRRPVFVGRRPSPRYVLVALYSTLLTNWIVALHGMYAG